MPISILIQVVNFGFGLLALALILRVILPFVRVSPSNPFMKFLTTITEPLLRPVRRVVGKSLYGSLGGLYVDLAPLVALLVLWLAQAVVMRILLWVAVPPLWLFQPGKDLGGWLAGVINLLFQLYTFALLARILLEWVQVSYATPLMRFLWNITEPLLGPLRKRLPLLAGGLDFSPIVALLILWVAEALLVSVVQVIF